jgi:hypothetical protein
MFLVFLLLLPYTQIMTRQAKKDFLQLSEGEGYIVIPGTLLIQSIRDKNLSGAGISVLQSADTAAAKVGIFDVLVKVRAAESQTGFALLPLQIYYNDMLFEPLEFFAEYKSVFASRQEEDRSMS